MVKIVKCCIFLCFYGCVRSDDYPKMIIDLNKQAQYDIAKFEFYKINSFYEGSCKAIVCYLVDGKTKCDTFNVLSLNIRFDTIMIERDTSYYYFSFFDKSRNIDALVLPTIDYQCNFVYAIGYIKDMKNPFKYLIAESGYAYYGEHINPKDVNQIFKKNLNSNDVKINKWIIDFVEENPDLISEE